MSGRALRAFRIGAWSWAVTGALHLFFEARQALQSEAPADAAANAVMRGHVVEIAGIRRSLFELNKGFSIAMALVAIFIGLLCLLVARSAPQLVEASRSLTLLGLVASLALLGVSLWLFPTPPIVTFTVASAAFGVAFVAPRPAHRPAPA